MQYPRAPLNSWIPRIPKTIRNMRQIRSTFIRLGIDESKESTTTFIPSFFETILRGLKALKALKPFIKETEDDP